MRPYLDAGFTGFTFNNNLYATPEPIAEVGEVLRLIGGWRQWQKGTGRAGPSPYTAQP